jgi:hypothetical protein
MPHRDRRSYGKSVKFQIYSHLAFNQENIQGCWRAVLIINGGGRPSADGQKRGHLSMAYQNRSL